jgi:hypothetical protein
MVNALVEAAPTLSVTCTVTVNKPVCEAVPSRSPLELRFRPAGRTVPADHE